MGMPAQAGHRPLRSPGPVGGLPCGGRGGRPGDRLGNRRRNFGAVVTLWRRRRLGSLKVFRASLVGKSSKRLATADTALVFALSTSWSVSLQVLPQPGARRSHAPVGEQWSTP